MAHTNTTAKPLRLPAGFNNKYDYGLVTTQQRTLTIKAPAGFKICNLWLAPTQQRTMTIKVPAGFTQQPQRSKRSQTITMITNKRSYQ